MTKGENAMGIVLFRRFPYCLGREMTCYKTVFLMGKRRLSKGKCGEIMEEGIRLSSKGKRD